MLCCEFESTLGFFGIYFKPLRSELACKFICFLQHGFYLVNFNNGLA